ncbi:MAG: hypothetical protein LUG18_15990 [Candidatus Azobacteroides sp.]|nr:hypothetical protein [Candidatus Azobacteroides sp.]
MGRKTGLLLPTLLLSISFFAQSPAELIGKWELNSITPFVETNYEKATRWLQQTIRNAWHPEYHRFEEYTPEGDIISRESKVATYKLYGNRMLREEQSFSYYDVYSLIKDSLLLYRDFKDEYLEMMEVNNVVLEKAMAEVLYIKLHEPEKVDKLPTYPGGEKALDLFIRQHLVLPEKGEECIVTIPVIINKSGELMHNQSGRTHAGLSIGGVPLGTYHQAIRDLLLVMPNWKPATKNGYPVNVQLYMPFEFK